MSTCKWCRLECKRIFCSKKCNNAFHKNNRKICVTCPDCRKSVLKHELDAKKSSLCASCAMKKNHADQEGNKNPAWRGGFKYWQKGKLGKDDAGLSWKKQRRLAWERDNYTCKKCGEEKQDRNPDVHHKIPYRISRSHALKNLVSLCKKCHKIEDEKYKQVIY